MPPNLKPKETEENIDDSLLALLEATTAKIGEDFFNVFVANLAKAYGAKMAFVNELIDNDPLKVRSLAFWLNGQLTENIEYAVATTPCETVYRDGQSYFPADIQNIFKDDQDLVDLDLHSYLGILLNNKEGDPIGHICVLGDEPVGEHKNATTFLKIFSSRASAELERLKAEREIVRQRTYLKEMVDEQTRDLKQAKENAEKANNIKTEFLERMSHELRTPLHNILGFASIIDNDKEKILSEDYKNHITHVLNSGNHLLKLLSDVLDFSLIEKGKLETIPEICNIKKICDDCITSQEIFANKNNVSIYYKDDIDSNLSIEVDAARLKQIINNLISNAIKFNKTNGEVIIDIKSTEDNKVKFSVTDTGPGMSENEKNLVFEKFERLDADKECIPGTGIGLALTKRLVEVMEGKIYLSSESGTTFTIEFNKFI